MRTTEGIIIIIRRSYLQNKTGKNGVHTKPVVSKHTDFSIYMRPQKSQARQTRRKEVFTRCPSNK